MQPKPHAPARSTAIAWCLALALAAPAPAALAADPISPDQDARIVLMGGGLGSRMVHFDHFETGLHLRYPGHRLVVRNISDEGNTPSFRPHSGRADQLGFPGAEGFHHPYSDGNTGNGQGHLETEEQWLEMLRPDVLIAFFGFTESFLGSAGLDHFRAELDAFVKHTLAQPYNGKRPPHLVLVSPTAYQDLTAHIDVPDGGRENSNLAAYSSIIKAVAIENDVRFVDAFTASLSWFEAAEAPLTIDGVLLNDAGYQKLAKLLIDQIFNAPEPRAEHHRDRVHAAVVEKNWLWINDYKIPNGVHVFGRRYEPFGPANYPFEIKKIREMTEIRDRAIWAAASGTTIDVGALDAQTTELPEVTSNYNDPGRITFLYGVDALNSITVADGYQIEQWATEQEFPDLSNPVQMTFDNQGRLWVATMPSYPHWRPGDPRPDDKLLILEDTDGDGKADRQTVFADGLHLPMGFEITAEGVFVSQGVNLILLRDTSGDGIADSREIILSGFDDHDTHHAISAFASDPSGAFLMAEGVFLRTSVETPYGPVRGFDGGFYRYNPQRRHLERHAQLPIPNPWGIAFDSWGQHFYLHTSGPDMRWMLPGSMRPRYGTASHNSRDLLQSERVRPTSGLEFISSSHFPEGVQGDILLNNNIGFLGTKQHELVEQGTGYTARFRQDLVKSSDPNFRPVDLEFAPDGSLYLVDWHNPLIGHMQHNARDPYRDHHHGRIYRVTYPARPLVLPPPIAGAPIAQLLDNLKLPESRARERSRRELRGRDPGEVLATLSGWVNALDPSHPDHDHHLVEALWVSWGMNRIDRTILDRVLASDDHRARAAAVRVVRYGAHQIPDHVDLLRRAITDPHGRVQMESIIAASWLGRGDALSVLAAANSEPAAEGPADADHVEVAPGGREITITPPAAAKSNVTAVTMALPGDNRTINLAELEVRAGGQDITASVSLSQSSEYNNGQFPVRNLVDGNRDNFSHTAFQRDPWLRLEFGQPVALDRVRIWNRRDFEDRFDGARVTFWKGEEELATLVVRIAGGGSSPFADDDWLDPVFSQVLARLNDLPETDSEPQVTPPDHLADEEHRALFVLGAEVFRRDAHCSTCHQPDGRGLPDAGFPPLAGTRWVTQQDDRLIKLTLHGLHGPIEVEGTLYPGLVPMTGFGALLTDREVAAVLTYVRNEFGNQAPPILPDHVARIREQTANHVGFFSPSELLEQYPHE